jgi:hypothetical protein
MPSEIRLSVGLRCKACDSSLDDTFDKELCVQCLMAVADANQEFYAEQDKKALKALPGRI